MTAHDKTMRAYMVQYNGYEVCTEGDAFLVAFHCPEDACAWCVAIQQVGCHGCAEGMNGKGGILSFGRHNI